MINYVSGCIEDYTDLIDNTKNLFKDVECKGCGALLKNNICEYCGRNIFGIEFFNRI